MEEDFAGEAVVVVVVDSIVVAEVVAVDTTTTQAVRVVGLSREVGIADEVVVRPRLLCR